jgi:hypothetical protein
VAPADSIDPDGLLKNAEIALYRAKEEGRGPDEQRRALRLLAGTPNGCTEAEMQTHGFELATLGDLMFRGLALAAPRDALPVMWIEITEAGRKAIAD